MKVKKVQNNLKELRFKNKISQEQLAMKVGCTRQTIHSIENNKYSPSFLLVSKIAYVLNSNANEIITITFEKV